MLLIIGVGFIVNSLWTNQTNVLSYATSVSAVTLLQETNTQRTQQNIGALALNNKLSQAAQDKANDMAVRNYWSHVTPEGAQPWQFISAVGYEYTLAGENLAYGFATSSDTVAGWMNSSAHRDNLLKSGYKEVGFGIANVPNYQDAGEQTIVVAMYATPAKAIVAAAQSAPKPVSNPLPASLPADTSTSSPAIEPAVPITPPTNSPAVPASDLPRSVMPEPITPPEEKTQDLVATPVSRFEVLTAGNAQWAIMVLAALASMAAISFVYRHGKMWRRYLVKGERFIIKHPLYDICLVAAVVVSVVLSRTSGFIQ
jgi:hypothetical protein